MYRYLYKVFVRKYISNKLVPVILVPTNMLLVGPSSADTVTKYCDIGCKKSRDILVSFTCSSPVLSAHCFWQATRFKH